MSVLRPDLPVYKCKDRIVQAVRENQVIVLESPTGSGKSTQVPLILYEEGYSKNGMIGMTQPRRIATQSIAEYLQAQVDTEGLVSWKTRFYDSTELGKTEIKVMTDGILLQELKSDPILSRYSVIIVDEVHERSLNIDFTLGLLKQITQVRKDLKIILSSATINTKVFSDFFDGAPIIYIDSHPYNVDVHYEPVEYSAKGSSKGSDKFFKKVVTLVGQCHKEHRGDVLVFMSGEADIRECISALDECPFASELDIYPLYGRLGKDEQNRVFNKTTEGHTKVVIATNVAETSITIDGIVYVIDSGICKQNIYSFLNGTSELAVLQTSRASSEQRKGRAGRTREGVCYRLFSEESFNERKEYTEEEILHSDLSEVILRMSDLGIYDMDAFDFISRPDKEYLKDAERTLLSLGAIEKNHHLTSIGSMMVKFPLEPRLARVLIEAILYHPDVIPDVCIGIGFLSAKTPFITPVDEEMEAREAHHDLLDNPKGDFIAWLRLFKMFKACEDKEAFCKVNYLDKPSMDEIDNVRQQLLEMVGEMGIPITYKESKRDYLTCILSGLRQYVLRYTKKGWKGVGMNGIAIHPSASRMEGAPEFIVCGEIVRTTKMYARSWSPVYVEQIKEIDPNILREIDKRTSEDRNENKKVQKGTHLIRGGIPSKSPLGKVTKEMVDLVPNIDPVTSRPTKKINPKVDSLSKISSYCDYLMKPYSKDGETFTYIALRREGGKYALYGEQNLVQAILTSIDAMDNMLHDLPRNAQSIRKYLNKKIKLLSDAL